MILMGARLWADLGLDGIELQLNSLGQPEERARHRAALVAYFEENAELLDEDGKRRLHTNPLRILDSKNPGLQDLCAAAPRLIDFLGDESLAPFRRRAARPARRRHAYTINPRLVRGLDYYNLTVFEWVTDRLGAQGTVCAGGRYDGLVEPARRQAGAGLRFCHGRRAPDRADQGCRRRAGRPGAGCLSGASGRGASRLAFRVAEGLRDQGDRTSCCIAAAAASSRR
jgi:histidyl-tRNA synthetase